MRGESSIGRWAERTSIAYIEGRAVQRANEPRATKASLIEPRIGMCANVIEGVQSRLRPADDDFPATDGADDHGTFDEFGERNVNALIVAQGCVPELEREMLPREAALTLDPTIAPGRFASNVPR
jgi:hypothetical protein